MKSTWLSVETHLRREDELFSRPLAAGKITRKTRLRTSLSSHKRMVYSKTRVPNECLLRPSVLQARSSRTFRSNERTSPSLEIIKDSGEGVNEERSAR